MDSRYFYGKVENKMDVNVFYISEEEKQTILRNRLEAERRANRRKLTPFERTHRIAGVCLLIIAIFSLIVFQFEGLVAFISCGLFSIIGFVAKEEDREGWLDL